jgi:hypothetical protein
LFSARDTVISPTPANLATSCIRALGGTITFCPEFQNLVHVVSTDNTGNPGYPEAKDLEAILG